MTTNDFNIGLYLGDYIYYNHLPILNVLTFEFSRPNKIVPISIGDEKQYFKLKEDPTKNEEYANFLIQLEKKYLPETIEIYLDKVNFENINQLKDGIKEGIINKLWKSESLPYKIESEDIEITEKMNFIVVKLKRTN